MYVCMSIIALLRVYHYLHYCIPRIAKGKRRGAPTAGAGVFSTAFGSKSAFGTLAPPRYSPPYISALSMNLLRRLPSVSYTAINDSQLYLNYIMST